MADIVQIPGGAVDSGSSGNDLLEPTTLLLQKLGLLSDPTSSSKVTLSGGTPRELQLIEAGVTSVTKWWTAGGAATVAVIWGSVSGWWATQDSPVRSTALDAAAIVTAALILAVGYLLATDLRSRGTAACARISARAVVADRMIKAAEAASQPHAQPPAANSPASVSASAQPAGQIIPLPKPLEVANLDGTDEPGWMAVAMMQGASGDIKYVVVKEDRQQTLAVPQLSFKAMAAATSVPWAPAEPPLPAADPEKKPGPSRAPKPTPPTTKPSGTSGG